MHKPCTKETPSRPQPRALHLDEPCHLCESLEAPTATRVIVTKLMMLEWDYTWEAVVVDVGVRSDTGTGFRFENRESVELSRWLETLSTLKTKMFTEVVCGGLRKPRQRHSSCEYRAPPPPPTPGIYSTLTRFANSLKCHFS